MLRERLSNNDRIISEGTQGYGLSLLHSPFYPYITSRDTTAAGFLSEAGLSPLDVDDIVLTIRAFPIRVAGNSGPLKNETNWNNITLEGKHSSPIEERTSVTQHVRRVAKFDPEIVLLSIQSNTPTRIVLNHLDYICSNVQPTRNEFIKEFILYIESSINRSIDLIGFGPSDVRNKNAFFLNAGKRYA